MVLSVEVPELKNVPKIFFGNNKDQRNLSNPSHVQYEAVYQIQSIIWQNLKLINCNVNIWNVHHKHKKVQKRSLTKRQKKSFKLKVKNQKILQVKIKKDQIRKKKNAQFFDQIYAINDKNITVSYIHIQLSNTSIMNYKFKRLHNYFIQKERNRFIYLWLQKVQLNSYNWEKQINEKIENKLLKLEVYRQIEIIINKLNVAEEFMSDGLQGFITSGI
ncbi:unnamed protein product [Paramecium octaurelia]|uniref:Uncharacterized protein n=1 Tax=Paramecium octaurelia TaxID=43137 RepID=A0A8S1YN30_PAROT|nr:unnamed protein product [Paramecium octaurelia]